MADKSCHLTIINNSGQASQEYKHNVYVVCTVQCMSTKCLCMSQGNMQS